MPAKHCGIDIASNRTTVISRPRYTVLYWVDAPLPYGSDYWAKDYRSRSQKPVTWCWMIRSIVWKSACGTQRRKDLNNIQSWYDEMPSGAHPRLHGAGLSLTSSPLVISSDPDCKLRLSTDPCRLRSRPISGRTAIIPSILHSFLWSIITDLIFNHRFKRGCRCKLMSGRKLGADMEGLLSMIIDTRSSYHMCLLITGYNLP